MKRIQAATLSFEPARLRALEPDNWAVLTRALTTARSVRQPGHGTASIDEWWRIYYDPDWFGKLDPQAAAAVLVHEIWHALRFHHDRARGVGVGPEHRLLWNYAADVEIHTGNERLLSSLRISLRPLTRDSFDPPLPKGGIAETWYQDLLARESTRRQETPWGDVLVPLLKGGYPEVSRPMLGSSGSCGIPGEWEAAERADRPPGLPKDRAAVLARQVAEDVRAGLGRGTIEGGARRWAEEVLNPQVDWRTRLRLGFQGVMAPVCGHATWTYRMTARRQPHDPRIVNPGWQDHLPSVAFLLDTSGSMSEKQLGVCLGEVRGLLALLCRGRSRPHVHVYSCDAAVTEARQVWPGGEVELFGGGGTDLRVGLEKIEDDVRSSRHAYDLVVCMTDALTPWPEEPLSMPLLTVLVGGGSYPEWMAQSPNEVVRVEVEGVT